MRQWRTISAAQSISAGHIHGIQKVYKRVKLPGSSRWVIVTLVFRRVCWQQSARLRERKRDQIHWIQACQLVTVNPHGDDVHINEIPFHEAADGGLICGGRYRSADRSRDRCQRRTR